MNPYASLAECRGFRHVVRNIYTFNLRPSRIVDLSNNLDGCFAAVVADLMAFTDYLNRLAREIKDANTAEKEPQYRVPKGVAQAEAQV